MRRSGKTMGHSWSKSQAVITAPGLPPEAILQACLVLMAGGSMGLAVCVVQTVSGVCLMLTLVGALGASGATWVSVRRRGLVAYLPRGMQRALMHSVAEDVLGVTSLEDVVRGLSDDPALRARVMNRLHDWGADLSARELQNLLRALPPVARRALEQPLLTYVPQEVQPLLMPTASPAMDLLLGRQSFDSLRPRQEAEQGSVVRGDSQSAREHEVESPETRVTDPEFVLTPLSEDEVQRFQGDQQEELDTPATPTVARTPEARRVFVAGEAIVLRSSPDTHLRSDQAAPPPTPDWEEQDHWTVALPLVIMQLMHTRAAPLVRRQVLDTLRSMDTSALRVGLATSVALLAIKLRLSSRARHTAASVAIGVVTATTIGTASALVGLLASQSWASMARERSVVIPQHPAPSNLQNQTAVGREQRPQLPRHRHWARLRVFGLALLFAMLGAGLPYSTRGMDGTAVLFRFLLAKVQRPGVRQQARNLHKA